MLTRKRVLAAKIETTVGTPIALAAADAAFNVFDAVIQPQIDFEEREGQSAFSPLPGSRAGALGQVTFAVEAHGSGSVGSPVPAWASTFLPACGFVDSSDTFSPESTWPGVGGAGTKTLTIGMYEDGVFKSIAGAMGSCVFQFTAGRIVRINFTFTGVWQAPSDVAILAPDYPSVAPLRFVSSGLAIGSDTPRVSSLSLDLGNEVTPREDANAAAGYIAALVAGRRITGSLDPEAQLVATWNMFADWSARTEALLAITLGSGSADGNSIVFNGPKCQFTNIQEGDRRGVQIETLEFQLNRSADAGDDELTIEFM